MSSELCRRRYGHNEEKNGLRQTNEVGVSKRGLHVLTMPCMYRPASSRNKFAQGFKTHPPMQSKPVFIQ